MTRALLILRPEPGASATAARAAALDLPAIVAPLFAVVATDWVAPDPERFDALFLTSAHAARLGGAALARYAGLPVYAVGAATAAAARAAGFATVHSGEADAASLLAAAAGDGARRLLHLAAREHRAAAFPGVAVERRIVYAADAAARLPPPASDALAGGAVALLHSPRAAATLRALLGDGTPAPATIAIAAISPAALAAAGTGWAAAVAAGSPTDDALLAAAARLCD